MGGSSARTRPGTRTGGRTQGRTQVGRSLPDGSTTGRGDRTRRAILDAALELYAEGGFRGTGLTAIGQRAGVTHPAILYHFGSSSRLLQAVLAERDRRFGAETGDAWAGRTGLDALRRLPTVARWNLEHLQLAKVYSVLQAENLDADAEAHAYFLARRRRVRSLLGSLIEEGQACGDIRAEVDARRKADEIIAFMEGAQLTAILDPEVDLVALFQSYTDALVAAIGVAGEGKGAPAQDDRL